MNLLDSGVVRSETKLCISEDVCEFIIGLILFRMSFSNNLGSTESKLLSFYDDATLVSLLGLCMSIVINSFYIIGK